MLESIPSGADRLWLDFGRDPVRLVAPDRRGYWWVKWVSTITLDELPS